MEINRNQANDLRNDQEEPGFGRRPRDLPLMAPPAPAAGHPAADGLGSWRVRDPAGPSKAVKSGFYIGFDRI